VGGWACAVAVAGGADGAGIRPVAYFPPNACRCCIWRPGTAAAAAAAAAEAASCSLLLRGRNHHDVAAGSEPKAECQSCPGGRGRGGGDTGAAAVVAVAAAVAAVAAAVAAALAAALVAAAETKAEGCREGRLREAWDLETKNCIFIDCTKDKYK
jgi:hypothetical protein